MEQLKYYKTLVEIVFELNLVSKHYSGFPKFVTFNVLFLFVLQFYIPNMCMYLLARVQYYVIQY